MKKLKLLFPLLGTSAIVVAPAMSAQVNQNTKANLSLENKDLIYNDNNSKMYLNGRTEEYYYDLKDSFSGSYYSEANINFTLTSYGATQLAKAEIATKHTTGTMIMYFLAYGLFNKETQLKHFGYGYANSYLNEIENNSNDNIMKAFDDKDAYNDFINHMSQPASVVYKITDMYKHGDKLPQIAVRFHYDYHTFAKDDFDVSFTMGKIPPTPQSSLTPASFIGHFPGMGPYGKVGDQDHAKLIGTDPAISLKFDLSTTSINYINNNIIMRYKGPVNSMSLVILDYLHDAYPSSSDWKGAIAGILREGGVANVNREFNKLVDFIGTYQKDGRTFFKLTPAYYYIDQESNFTAAKNQPFS